MKTLKKMCTIGMVLCVVCGMALTVVPFLLYTCTRVGWSAWRDLLDEALSE